MRLTDNQNLISKNKSVQSILFDKKIYNNKSASNILNIEEYNNFGYDETKNLLRFRQFNPGFYKKYPKYKIEESNIFPGVRYVIEY